MSDDKNKNNVTPLRIVQGLKKENEPSNDDPSNKSAEEVFEDLAGKMIQPGDFEGFFRVLELLRTLGDEINLKIDNEAIEIVAYQFPNKPIEIKGKQIRKNVKIGNVVINFNIPAYFLYTSHDDWQTHVHENSIDLEKMILSLARTS